MTFDARPLQDLVQSDAFLSRHNGPDTNALTHMLGDMGWDTVNHLIEATIPADIRLDKPLALAPPTSEAEALTRLRAIASQNTVATCYLGQGYYPTHTPSPILRNVLENPGWYTAYTPYQPEISQGRLEALLNFQQMIIDLTGMPVANASLLDEGTAAAEAMALCRRANRKNKSNRFFIADDVFAQTRDVVETRAHYMGIELVTGPAETLGEYDVFGALVQYCGESGHIHELAPLIDTAHNSNAMVAVAADPLSLALLEAPGQFGADIVFGSAQRFGVPMGYGGPHAAFFAASDALKRSIPGRIIGVSKDSRDQVALRMAMQTREQHIRREKATSNICTAQALLANMASFYAVYHGKDGLITIASRVHRLTTLLAQTLREAGISLRNERYFDTLTLDDYAPAELRARAEALGINLRYRPDGGVGISLNETTTLTDLDRLCEVLIPKNREKSWSSLDQRVIEQNISGIPESLERTSDFLTHPVFTRYRSETELMRYMKRLENKDLSLVHSMIPLGSCTMKLNAASEMIPISWPEFANMHPFAPSEQTHGYAALITELSDYLAEITGYDSVSMQPNSGAQGEYAGLIAIRGYQKANGQAHRNICLIPSSAHGTNPASATMADMQVVVVECDSQGNIDLDDLASKAAKHSDNLSAIMLTYPSTHGVFEAGVRKACEIVHEHGGQVYIDGANMNAQVGLCRPGDYGGDVSHLNLHKTFCIPHGGGGPGMGPIGVKAHLAAYLPGHRSTSTNDATGAVASAPFGSASILPISWMYITMMGEKGLTRASELAIVNANYIAHRLSSHYTILYKGTQGNVAHECILDLRRLKAEAGISEEDIAKRLIDYGFHAPTMSFPVAGTLMVEPTESESLRELDRFCDAMIGIRKEIDRIVSGEWPADDNPLVNAPHTHRDSLAEWQRPYSLTTALYPSGDIDSKYWPSVNRVDNVHGDRNLVCSCPSIEHYR
ncbi:aminomethyl-transferring glycine dehydrogenase [Larsenimonas suaedae]|uniref:Glycine dehydrogenase (decarboxylating) n=1 Tax=Larsenimonas suaedae TaxID=1851019 RepID=A0ABU1GVF9_9GAMM|nr:aminomethyl-transferring glycine dehydrogenase [Larsenimonas suaedae]MCM2971311.1 aminomethyl-transferring glycine dehydrogenase [Larsenimonas suaedae]MDR5896021.1 aminomethyl-transferring glycine dehydrogenase [Larsenimonas suaedae]